MSMATVFTGGLIRTLDPRCPEPAALAIADGRVLAAGSLEEVRAAAASAAIVHLGGDCLVPGFIDVHHHFVLAALLARRPSVASATNVAAVLEVVRQAASDTAEGWIVVYGLVTSHLVEDGFPTMQALDAVSPDRPVAVIGFSLHEAAVNSVGLERIGGPAAFVDDPKAVIVDRRGAPTGEVREHAAARILQQIVAERVAHALDDAIEDLAAYGRHLARLGVVHVVDPGLGPAEERLLLTARARGALPISVDYMLAAEAGLFRPAVDRLEGGGQSRQIKVFVDGGAMVALSWSAAQILRYSLALPVRAVRDRSLRLIRRALREDVLPGPDRRYHGGIRNFTREELNTFCRRAFDKGFSVALHASGSEAIDMAIEALAQRGDRAGPLPDQLIHFLFPGPRHVEQAAALGAAVVLQPAMVAEHACEVRRSVPPGDFELAPPLDAMRAHGVFMVLSSDAPIAEAAPLNILAAAVKPAAGEGLSPQVAMEQLTIHAARALARPDKGALSRGQVADVVRLDRDPLDPATELTDTRVVGTCAAGRWVHAPPEHS